MRHEVLKQINSNSRQAQLANMHINDEEIQEIIQKIKQLHPKIVSIDLDGNELSDKGAIILANALSEFKQVKELSLQFNNIAREGAISLFGLIKNLKDLSILFHGNKIVDEGEMAEIKSFALKH